MAYSTMLIAPSVMLFWVLETAVLTAIGAAAPSAFGGCTVTPGGSAPRTPGRTVEALAMVGNGVNVGRGVFVGVGTRGLRPAHQGFAYRASQAGQRQQEDCDQQKLSASRSNTVSNRKQFHGLLLNTTWYHLELVALVLKRTGCDSGLPAPSVAVTSHTPSPMGRYQLPSHFTLLFRHSTPCRGVWQSMLGLNGLHRWDTGALPSANSPLTHRSATFRRCSAFRMRSL